MGARDTLPGVVRAGSVNLRGFCFGREGVGVINFLGEWGGGVGTNNGLPRWEIGLDEFIGQEWPRNWSPL